MGFGACFMTTTSKRKNVLLCGGSGLIGSALAQYLEARGYQVQILTRRPASPQRYWDPKNAYLHADLLQSADIIINLAGAGIADRRWSQSRKKEILESRIQSTRILYQKLHELGHRPSLFINASAIGYYGNRAQELLTEESGPGRGFLPYVGQCWEQEALRVSELGIRTVIFRLGVVLSKAGGALPKMLLPFRFGAGMPLGDGRQFLSWLHIEDLCAMFAHAIEKTSMYGIYNAVSPQPLSNYEFYQTIAKLKGSKLLRFAMPSQLLRLGMGEMACLLLDSACVLAKKIQATGFQYKHPTLEAALRHLFAPDMAKSKQGVIKQKKSAKQSYAFFDLDRTLLPDDTMLLFCNYILRKEAMRRLYLLLFLPALFLYSLRLLKPLFLKRVFYSFLYRMRKPALDFYVEDFVKHVLRPRLFPEVLHLLDSHRQAGHKLILNTASIELYARRLAQELGFDLCYATKMYCLDPMPLFPVIPQNNSKEKKVQAMQQDHFGLLDEKKGEAYLLSLWGKAWDQAYTYTDSSNDLALIGLADHVALIQATEKKLLHAAAKKGWTMLSPSGSLGKARRFWRSLGQITGLSKCA